ADLTVDNRVYSTQCAAPHQLNQLARTRIRPPPPARRRKSLCPLRIVTANAATAAGEEAMHRPASSTTRQQLLAVPDLHLNTFHWSRLASNALRTKGVDFVPVPVALRFTHV
ncbi:unnamed protein product, partial [Mycena citricolor]